MYFKKSECDIQNTKLQLGRKNMTNYFEIVVAEGSYKNKK